MLKAKNIVWLRLGSRGCPYNRKFCAPNFGRKIRIRPIKSVINELKILVERYAIEHFEFSAELFRPVRLAVVNVESGGSHKGAL